MKRSHMIALGAVGVIAAGTFWGRETLDDRDAAPKDAAIYSGVAECISAGVLSREACETEFRKAADQHLAAAPKFNDMAACENQYGANQCRTSSHNGSSVIVPAMIGFMVANYLSNQRAGQPLLPANRLGAAPCPPGITPAMQPGCLMPRQASTSGTLPSSSTSSSSTSSSSTSWRSYSTTSGQTVSRTESGNGTTKVTSSATSSAGTIARGGFGSTGAATASHASS